MFIDFEFSVVVAENKEILRSPVELAVIGCIKIWVCKNYVKQCLGNGICFFGYRTA